jgi:uncharacterized membrane protein YhaH (DUF805 family)
MRPVLLRTFAVARADGNSGGSNSSACSSSSTHTSSSESPARSSASRHLGALIGEFSGVLVTFVPGLAVAVRRMHDTGRSGWWVLLSVVPFVGLLVLFWYCTDSRPANRWGPNPKASAPPTPLTLVYNR